MKRLAFKNPETVEIAGAKQKLEGLVEHLIPCATAQKVRYEDMKSWRYKDVMLMPTSWNGLLLY